jgi:hypothetical protein
MPRPHTRVYKSAKQSYVAGSVLEFHGFVPRFGPRGGRNVIDGFELVAEMTDINCDAATVEGEDCYRVWKRIRVEQVGGIVRWNLRGDESRVALYQLEGAERVREHADIADADNQSLTFSCYIPMSKRFAKRPADFALPADLLHKVSIECADASELSLGSAVVTIDSGRYYVVAHTHEEFDVELKCEDEVKAAPFPSTDGITLKVGGRLQDLMVFARGASGGAAMANFTDVRVEELIPVALTRDAELQRPFLRDRYNVENGTTDGASIRNEPAAGDLAVPVIWTDEDTSPFDGPIMDEAIVYATNSVASCIAIYRVVKPLSGQVAQGVLNAYGLSASDFRVKTEGKSKREAARWRGREDELAYMPKKGPLLRQGRRQAA